MIAARELFDLRAEWSLDIGVIEKDYVLGWLLAGIANHPDLAGTWVFKGGTCLRKCFYETYRFSEDLDFTVVAGGPQTPEELQPIFATIGEWVREESGIELVVDEAAFRRRRNRRGNPTTEGRIAYRGPNPPPQLPKVKLCVLPLPLPLLLLDCFAPVVRDHSRSTTQGEREWSRTLRKLRDVRQPELTDPVFCGLAGGRLQETILADIIRRAAKRAGIEKHVTAHTLRHTAATWLRQEVGDARLVGEYLGHADLSTVAR